MSGIKRTAADARFSDAVRARDNWTCQRCGKEFVPPTRALHAAHCFTRRCGVCTSAPKKPHVCSRLDMSNALALCYGCHQHVDSHADEKENLFRLRMGNDEYDRVAALAHKRRDRIA